MMGLNKMMEKSIGGVGEVLASILERLESIDETLKRIEEKR
jgi:archaellum component FlaC